MKREELLLLLLLPQLLMQPLPSWAQSSCCLRRYLIPSCLEPGAFLLPVQVDAWLMANPQRALAAVHFRPLGGQASDKANGFSPVPHAKCNGHGPRHAATAHPDSPGLRLYCLYCSR